MPDCALTVLDSVAELSRFRRRLRRWYRGDREGLPWRESADPYLVWVSEIMLQQTLVGTVKGCFRRFVEAFPTVAALAAADEQEVLRQWEGLGYYRRARHLHAAAKRIVADHGGELPQQVSQLQKLPGVGRYTAGAIASIAFDRPEPILEANTTRLFARLIAYRGDTRSGPGQKLLWRTAETLVPRSRPGEFNQALMDLGRLICKSQNPTCESCPVADSCLARRLGLEEKLPREQPRVPIEYVHEVAVTVWRRGRVLLRRCGQDERWAGLWDFPRFAVDGERCATEEILAGVRHLTGLDIEIGEQLMTIRHGVTRFRITLDCYEARFLDGAVPRGRDAPTRWVPPAALEVLPLSTTGRRLARLVADRKGFAKTVSA